MNGCEIMDFIEYSSKALRTANSNLSYRETLANCALGLCGESGEVADLIKKSNYHGHVLDYENVAKELGDILWYVNWMAESIGFSLEEIAVNNLLKLEKRYPDKFSSEASVNRKEYE